MKIQLTEIINNTGTVTKKYKADGDNIIVESAPTIYDGVAKGIELEFSEVSSYFNELSKRNDTCTVFGVCCPPGMEISIVTKNNLPDPLDGSCIARTKDFFSWANSGNVNLLHLDFDRESDSPESREEFLSELDTILGDAILAESGRKKSIMRWIRPSSSGSIKVSGKIGTGLHVYMAVKGDCTGLTDLIHRLSWLKSPGWKMTKAATILAESMIDPSVGSQERVVYTSDAEILGDTEGILEPVERECRWIPGGVLDADTARMILEEKTIEYRAEWIKFKKAIEDSPEVSRLRVKWKEEQATKLAERYGFRNKDAKKKASLLMDLILTSDMDLVRTDGSTVKVIEILTNFDEWQGVGSFVDPIKNNIGRNVGMILGTEEQPFLNSKSHGGVKYLLKWAANDLTEWVKEASTEDIEDNFSLYLANAGDLTKSQESRLVKVIAKKVGASVKAVNEDIEEIRGNVPGDFNKDEEESTGKMDNEYLSLVDVESTHSDIIDDYIRKNGGVPHSESSKLKSYGDSLYVWSGKDIWIPKSAKYVIREVRRDYNFVKTCKKVSDYKALTSIILTEDGLCTTEWDEAIGFPCADWFYKIDTENSRIIKTEYTQELGCRYKMPVSPEPYKIDLSDMPYWKKVVDNVENPVLFQQLIGLLLCGWLPKLQKAFTMYGEGGAGKGTTADCLTAALPQGRLTSMGLEEMNRQEYRVQLADARINFVNEVRSDKKINTTGLKEILGGGLLTGRALYGQPVTFRPNVGIVISFNNFIPLDEFNSATARRFGDTIVKFTKNHEDQIENLADMIIEKELSKLIQWAIDGVEMYMQGGLETQLSHELWEKWSGSLDPIRVFVGERLKRLDGSYAKRTDLWESYKEFCNDSGYFLDRKGVFYDKLEGILGTPSKIKGEFKFKGWMFR